MTHLYKIISFTEYKKCVMCSIRLDDDVIGDAKSSRENEDGLAETTEGKAEEVVLDEVAGRAIGHCSRPLLSGHGNLQWKLYKKLTF